MALPPHSCIVFVMPVPENSTNEWENPCEKHKFSTNSAQFNVKFIIFIGKFIVCNAKFTTGRD